MSFEESLVRYFKTRRCSAWDSVHDHRSCEFFHSSRDSDRRRTVLRDGCQQLLYSADPCVEKFDSQRQCSAGDACGFCHSTAELLYHPDIFRKRLCHQGHQCPRGRFCAFAHSRSELLVPHFSEDEEQNPSEEFIAYHFKTQWCPIGGPHDWESCVYAHTYRDWRRTPLIGYSSRPCPHWSKSVASGPAELTYKQRCPRGMSCALAHGSKEQLYHPQFYKTNPCSERFCRRAALCAFHHGSGDARSGAPSRRPVTLPRNADRDRLQGAEELLIVHQPTFLRPPKYHALEPALEEAYRPDAFGYDASGGFVGNGGPLGRGAGRGLRGRQRQTPMRASAWAGQDMQEQMQQAANGCGGAMGMGLAPVPENFLPEFMPYYCQWMPCADASGQAMFPEEAESWGQDAYAQLLWDPSAGAFSPAMVQGPWLVEAGMPGEMAELAEALPLDVEHLPSVMALDGALQVEGFEQRGKGGRRSKPGVRTPSWSPPQSATPTEVPSPRPAELTGSSGCSGDASDDVAWVVPRRA